MEHTDEELISKYRDGDEDAFKMLVERYAGPIYGFASRMIGKRGEADDAAQETFVKVWRSLGSYKMNGTFKPWIFAIARNTAIDRLRKKNIPVFSDFEDAAGKNALLETLSDPEVLPQALIEKAEQKRLLDNALQVLSVEDREILTLHYDEDLTFDEIGTVLKKPLNTVKSKHRRALIQLREALMHKEDRPVLSRLQLSSLCYTNGTNYQLI